MSGVTGRTWGKRGWAVAEDMKKLRGIRGVALCLMKNGKLKVMPLIAAKRSLMHNGNVAKIIAVGKTAYEFTL